MSVLGPVCKRSAQRPFCTKGIPELVGSYPINDPDGYYPGFAASGYGMMWNSRYLKAKKLPAPGVVPLIMPPFVGAVAMQLLFGANGSANMLLDVPLPFHTATLR